MHRLSRQYPRYGSRRIRVFLGREGIVVGKDKCSRLWAEQRLQVPKKRPRRRVAASRPRPLAPARANSVWSYDFVFDACANGQQIKCLTVVDEYMREALPIDVAGSIRSRRVIEILARLISVRGLVGGGMESINHFMHNACHKKILKGSTGMFRFTGKLICNLALLVGLVACGNSGNNKSSDNQLPSQENSTSAQLAAAIDLTDIKVIGLANNKSQSNVLNNFADWLEQIIVGKNAYAASEQLDCINQPKSLIGIKENGNIRDLNATKNANSKSGFCEIVDIGRYLISSTSGIFKKDKACDLVLIQKSSGKLHCFSDFDPVQYLLTGVKENARVSPNGQYLYLTVKRPLGDMRHAEKIMRFDLTGDVPAMDEVVEYQGSGYVPIFEYLPLNNGSIVIWRMEPSTAPETSTDGYLRLVEYWTLSTGNPKQVATVDYVFMQNPTDSRNYSGCFVEYGMYGVNDEDAVVVAISGVWRLTKPSTPTSNIAPIKIANSRPAHGRICSGSASRKYSVVHAQNFYSIYDQVSGNVSLVEDTQTGTENLIALYNTGNTFGAFSDVFSKIFKNKDYMLVVGMNQTHENSDSLYAIRLNANGIANPLDRLTVFDSSANKKIRGISANADANVFTISSRDRLTDEVIVDRCEMEAVGATYACSEIMRQPPTIEYSNFEAIGL